MPTKLTKDEEAKFQEWYKGHSSKNKINPDPDTPEHYYDYRGAWKEGMQGDERGHLPDTFKTPGHPTFSVESTYYRPGMKAGKWEGEKFIPFEEWSKKKGVAEASFDKAFDEATK